MNEDNPYRPPAVTEPGRRSVRGLLGAILSGLVAIGLATFLMGPIGLIAALLGVGSWWAYKFRPRAAAPDAPAASAYLQRLEEGRTGEAAPGGSDIADIGNSSGEILGNLRL
ncbi:MAG: hypothetical protein ACLQIB_08240 [Isosphaeraceae bacterium]